MSFFDRLLKRYPKREEWGDISQCIAVGFENARREWFVSFCVSFLRDALQMELTSELPSDVELALKAFQLGSVSGFAGEHNYLPISESQNFCDLFWAQVGGTELPKICDIVQEFIKVAPKAREFHLARRMVEHLVVGKATVADVAALTATVRVFALLSCIALATAFGDTKTVAKLRREIDDWVTNFPKHLENIVTLVCGPAKAA